MAKDYSIFKSARTAEELWQAYLTFRRAVNPEYTNESDSDMGNTMVQGVFGAVDYLHLRHDMETIQNIADRVERRESARAILQAYGTDLTPKSAATTNVVVSIVGNRLPMSDIPIDQFFAFYATTSGKKYCVPYEGLSWLAGRRTMTFPVVQGDPRSEALGNSNQSEMQMFYPQLQDILHYPGLETAIVRVNGVAWDVVYDFANSGPSDPHVMIQYLGSGRSRFIFGNNRIGLIPEDGATVSVECLVGGGSSGAVGVGAITEMLSQLVENGVAFSVSVTNPEATSGGSDEQSVRDAMTVNPHWWRAQDRCGPRPDVMALARKVPGVLDALSTRTGVTVITTYLLSDAADGYANDALLGEVLRYLQDRAMTTDDHLTARANVVFVDSDLQVRLKKKAKWQQVKPAVEKVVSDFFDLATRKAAGEALFGQEGSTNGHRYTSDLINIIEDVEGVDSVDLTKFTRVPRISYDQWTGNAGFGEVTISNDTDDEEVSVLFTSATSYIVNGTVSGEMGVGSLDTAFSDVAGKVSFTIVTGTTAMAVGDLASFRVSNLVGNIKLQPGEVAVLGSNLVERTN